MSIWFIFLALKRNTIMECPLLFLLDHLYSWQCHHLQILLQQDLFSLRTATTSLRCSITTETLPPTFLALCLSILHTEQQLLTKVTHQFVATYLIQALHLKFKIQLEIIWHGLLNNWDNGTGKQKRRDGWKFSDLRVWLKGSFRVERYELV